MERINLGLLKAMVSSAVSLFGPPATRFSNIAHTYNCHGYVTIHASFQDCFKVIKSSNFIMA